MNKLKELKTLVQTSDSYMWATRALILLLAFKALDYFYGMALVLPVFVAAAAAAPVFIKRMKQDRIAETRNHALTCLIELQEQANRDRKWSVPGTPYDESNAIRFAVAQRKVNAVHRNLELRAKHLDRCTKEGIAPHPGADWNAISQIAIQTTNMLESARWICKNNLRAEPGLLDPNWKLEACIHSESSLEDEAIREATVISERVVVDMGDYSSLRKHKTRPYGEAELLVFGNAQRSNDSR